MKSEKTQEKGREVKKVSKKKLETVKRLVTLMDNSNTAIIVSIKNLPSRQFQNIRKKLKGKAEIIVVKKNITLKALETSENKSLEQLKKYVCEDSAILFSKEDAFELAGFLSENKNPIRAKPKQIASEDIAIEEGPTDLPPGPAISELGNMGIKIAIEEGKIAIKERKIIAKKGEKITDAAALLMAKLEILPFRIGLEPIVLLEIKTSKIYTDIKIDKEKTIQELKTAAAKSLGFAREITYYCRETIVFLLAKASAEEKALEKLSPAQENAQQINNQEEK